MEEKVQIRARRADGRRSTQGSAPYEPGESSRNSGYVGTVGSLDGGSTEQDNRAKLGNVRIGDGVMRFPGNLNKALDGLAKGAYSTQMT